MSDVDNNLSPENDKFFDIIPSSKRSLASPTSRPLIVDNTPSQTDSMITANQQPDLPEAAPEQPTQEVVTSDIDESDNNLSEQNIAETQPPIVAEENPDTLGSDTQSLAPIEQPDAEELLLPAHASLDESPSADAVIIHSPKTSKFSRLKTWLIALLFIIIIAAVAALLYLFVFRSNPVTYH